MTDVPHTTDSSGTSSLSDFFTPEYLENRRRELAKNPEPRGMDELDPRGPSGHAYAIRKSTWLTSDFRKTHRKGAVDITPQQVIDVLNAASVKSWVLMGLHGYVGYLPQPRATQDVDVMVDDWEQDHAREAIADRWPQLTLHESEIVVRYVDPNDVEFCGERPSVVDLFRPWGPLQVAILEDHIIIDETTQHRIPKLEAALASEFAAMLTPGRRRDQIDYNCADFRSLVRANYDRIDRPAVRRLADLIWNGAADEIERFIEIAPKDEAFPI